MYISLSSISSASFEKSVPITLGVPAYLGQSQGFLTSLVAPYFSKKFPGAIVFEICPSLPE